MIYLTSPELLYIAERVLGAEPAVRDYGLLESAAARPQATAFDAEAYRGLDTKAAALLHSLARNHALIDGNKRLALGAVIAFYGVNGRRLTLTNDEAYDLIIDVAAGQLDSVDDIAARLSKATEARLGHRASGSWGRIQGEEGTSKMFVLLFGRIRTWLLLAIALPLARILVHRLAVAADRRDPSGRPARALHRADSAVTAVSGRTSRKAARRG